MQRFFLYILAINILSLSCSNTVEIEKEKLAIIYTGNIGGQKDPCGCKPPMGGYARRSTVINALRSEHDNIIILDSGAMLYSKNFILPPSDFLFRLNASVSVKAVEKIGIDAVNVSSYDLANSVDSLLAADKSTSFPWLSSNLTWRNSGDLVFKPDIIIHKGNVNVGVFGVMADNFMGATLYNEDSPLKVLDIIETSEKEVSKLKEECDLIIALAYMSMAEVQELSERVSGIDIIILSHNRYHTPSSNHTEFAPIKNGRTLIARCPDGGRVVGYLDLEIVNRSTDFEEIPSEESIDQNMAVEHSDNISLQSTYMNNFIDLGPEIKSDEEIKVIVDSVEEIKKAYRDSLGIK